MGSPETTFSYFTDPEKHCRWQGVEAELDPRPGGVYRVALAPQVWIVGEYLEVEPPHRLVLSWGVESSIGLPGCFQPVPPGSSTVEIRFVPDGEGTIIRVRHMDLPTEDARWGTAVGWNGFLPRLVTILEGGDPGEDPFMELSATLFARDAES